MQPQSCHTHQPPADIQPQPQTETDTQPHSHRHRHTSWSEGMQEVVRRTAACIPASRSLRRTWWGPMQTLPHQEQKSKRASSQRLTRRTHTHTAPGTGFFHRSAPTGGDAYGMPRNCRPLSVTTPRTGPSAAQTSTSTRATHAASQPPCASHSLRFAAHTSLDDILLRERRHQHGNQQRDDGRGDHVLKARPCIAHGQRPCQRLRKRVTRCTSVIKSKRTFTKKLTRRSHTHTQ